MKILVLMKTVDFIYAQTGTDLARNYVGPDDTICMLNPADEIAMEYALSVKDIHPETEIVAVSMGDDRALTGLLRGLAMGADRALHITHDDLADSWKSAVILSEACRENGFDMILCGDGSIDRNEGLVGPYVAEMLGIPHLSRVTRIAVDAPEEPAMIQRTIERGDRQILACRIPALFSVRKAAIVARYPTLNGLMTADSRPLEKISSADLIKASGEKRAAVALTELLELVKPKPKRKTDDGEKKKLSAMDRLKAITKKPARKKQSNDGNLIDASDKGWFDRLDRILKEAGIVS